MMRKLNYIEPEATRRTLALEDMLHVYLYDTLEYVLVKMDAFVFTTDFLILYTTKD